MSLLNDINKDLRKSKDDNNLRMQYFVYIGVDNKVYRLPVNPEEINETYEMETKEYDVLELGPVSVPSAVKLRKVSFKTELPGQKYSYVENSYDFHPPVFYINLFRAIMELEKPVRLAYGLDENMNYEDDITDTGTESHNLLVLIQKFDVTEKAGEEGDKYVSFEFLEYKPYESRQVTDYELVTSKDGVSKLVKKPVKSNIINPKAPSSYVVKSGDSLWSIAKKLYGDGAKCNIIFNANKDQINNPGIIKEGWKLNIPTESEFSKYSAPLPKIETKVKIDKTGAQTSSYNISGYQGGKSQSGKTHSSGGSSFGKSHSSGGGKF